MSRNFHVTEFISFSDDELPDAGVPIKRASDTAKLVFEFFGLDFGDKSLMQKATQFLNLLVDSDDLDLMRAYLWYDPVISVESVNIALVYGAPEFKLLEARPSNDISTWVEIETPWSAWYGAQARLIVEIARRTREEDAGLQHWLNYVDFILELERVQVGRKAIAELYDIRGLDFFLFHYMGGATNALSDSALFESAQVVAKALRSMGRTEEAILVETQIAAREKGLEEIKSEFNAISFEDSETELSEVDRFRLLAERYWVKHISSQVWKGLHPSSRVDLIDAFIAEQLITFKVLRSWTQVILPLCKIIERELGITFFLKWLNLIQQTTFTESLKHSKKSIRQRARTFELLKQCATKNTPPTLGQLTFVLIYLNDPIMDDCTDLFSLIRNSLSEHCDQLDDILFKLKNVLTTSYTLNGEGATVGQLRNAAAHPSEEGIYSWAEYLVSLKALFEFGPMGILNNIVIDLRVPLHASQKKFGDIANDAA